jgi:hypothetical protein
MSHTIEELWAIPLKPSGFIISPVAGTYISPFDIEKLIRRARRRFLFYNLPLVRQIVIIKNWLRSRC